MCSLDYKLLLEYLAVFLSWPPLVFFLGCICIFTFKHEIAHFFFRLNHAEFAGASLTASDLPQRPVGKTDVLTSNDNDSRAEEETLNLEDRKRFNFIKDRPLNVLHILNKMEKELAFEKIFNSVFGTQMQLLDQLVTVVPNGISVTEEMPRHFYELHIKLIAPRKPEFNDYLTFLINSNLLQIYRSPESTAYAVTNFGRDYLDYIKRNYFAIWNQRPL